MTENIENRLFVVRFLSDRAFPHRNETEYKDELPIRFSTADVQEHSGTQITYDEIHQVLVWLHEVKFTIKIVNSELEMKLIKSWYEIKDKTSFEVSISTPAINGFNTLLAGGYKN